MSLDQNFPERLKSARISKKMSKAELARQSGVTQQQIYRYETSISTPRDNIVAKLAKALDVSIKWLLDGQEEFQLRPPPPRQNTNNNFETFQEASEAIKHVLTLIDEQVEQTDAIKQNVSNPFSKFEASQTLAILNQAKSLLTRSIEPIENAYTQISKLNRSIKEHEKKYSLMSKLGKLDEYYEEQRDSAAYTVSYIIPQKLASSLLNISSEEESNIVLNSFHYWVHHMEIPKTISKEEAYTQLHIALNYLLLIAHLTNTNINANLTIGKLREEYKEYAAE